MLGKIRKNVLVKSPAMMQAQKTVAAVSSLGIVSSELSEEGMQASTEWTGR
jgi:hypothetical protein